MKKMELLAPAGDIQSARAAFAAGADACYIGGAFSARAYAANFKREEIAELVRYAHLRGKKVHVALNIMLKQREMEQALAEAEFLFEAGVDAVIAADLGFLRQAHFRFPGLALHASTQMGIQDAAGARLAAELGCSRVVAARETTLSGLKNMAQTGIEVEAFCHGALCSGISGACLLSGMAGGRSGNRGRCAQPCRQRYELLGRRAYHLSTKDLCAIGLLGELCRAGVCSIKIEGRMKRPEYVAIVTNAYRRALDALQEAKTFDLEAEQEELLKIYNRGGFCTGYLKGDRDVTYLQRPGHLGILLGKLNEPRAGRGTLQTKKEVYKGDGVEFRKQGDSHGGLVLPYADPVPGGFRIAVPPKAREGDEVYRTTDARQMQKARALMEDRFTLPVLAAFHAEVGKPASLHLSGGGCDVMVQTADPCPPAHKRMEETRIAASLRKTGGTVFAIKEVKVCQTGTPFLAVAALNALRREALEKLENAIVQAAYPRKIQRQSAQKAAQESFRWEYGADAHTWQKTSYLAAQVQTAEQAKAAWKAGADRVYMSASSRPQDFLELEAAGVRVYLALPAYLDDAEVLAAERLLDRYSCFCGILAGNLAGVALAQRRQMPFVSDIALNIASAQGVDCLRSMGAENVALSAELNLEEIRQINRLGSEVVVFGRIPVMHLRHCPLRKIGQCGRCGQAELRDEKGHAFPLVKGGIESCLLQVLASVPMAVGEVQKLRDAGICGMRLCFYGEGGSQVMRAVLAYRKAEQTGNNVDFSGVIEGRANKGHIERGVE